MKHCYRSGAVKRKKREHAVNELSKLNKEIRLIHLEVVDSYRKNAVSLINNPVTEDISENSYYSQCSTNVNVPAVDHFQQPETSSQPLISEVDDKMQAESLITEAKIEFSKDAGLV